MLPIFHNYTWMLIFLAVMIYILKDWRKIIRLNGYLKILYLTSFMSGIFLVDILSGIKLLEKAIPSYMQTLVPATILVYIVTLFGMNFKEIKNSDQSDEEKQKNYRKQIKYIIGLLAACVWFYFIDYVAANIVRPILIFMGLGK